MSAPHTPRQPVHSGDFAALLAAVQVANALHPAFAAEAAARANDHRAMVLQIQRPDALTQAAMGELR